MSTVLRLGATTLQHGEVLCAGFPNMTASYLEDSMGQVYADISDFLAIGIASSALSWTVIVTLGYAIMYAMGLSLIHISEPTRPY